MLDSKAVGPRNDDKSMARVDKLAMTSEQCAARILKGVAKNKAIIPVTHHAKVLRTLQRYFPGLMQFASRRMAQKSQNDAVDQGRQEHD